jgi:signal transduction histidine kinase
VAEEVTGSVNPRQRRLLEIASREVKRLTDLLNHFMQIARLEAGVVNIQPLATDASTLVGVSLHRLAPMAEAKRIKIQTQVPEGLPPVMGDPEHLQRVLINLIENSIKFSPSGGEVIVRVEPLDGGRSLRFSFSDRGPGIPKDEQPLIFHKYYRASTIRNQVEGLGLGLSLSKYIVEAHGGTIWLESQVGQGSTFSFNLPVASEG